MCCLTSDFLSAALQRQFVVWLFAMYIDGNAFNRGVSWLD